MIKNIVLVFAGFAFVGLAGCVAPETRSEPLGQVTTSDAFLERYYNADVEKGAKIVLVTRGESPSSTLVAFMMADLKDAGFTVKLLSPLDILPESVLKKITAQTKYSFTEMAIKSVAVTGFNGDRDKATLSEEASRSFLNHTDVREDDARVNDLVKYIDDYSVLIKKLDVDYIMTIRQGNPYSYYVEMINPRTSAISGLYYLSANSEGWNKRMTSLKDSSGRTISTAVSAGESPRYVEMQYCRYLTNLLSGKKAGWSQK